MHTWLSCLYGSSQDLETTVFGLDVVALLSTCEFGQKVWPTSKQVYSAVCCFYGMNMVWTTNFAYGFPVCVVSKCSLNFAVYNTPSVYGLLCAWVRAHPRPVGQNSNRGENYPHGARHTLLAAEEERVNCSTDQTISATWLQIYVLPNTWGIMGCRCISKFQ